MFELRLRQKQVHALFPNFWALGSEIGYMGTYGHFYFILVREMVRNRKSEWRRTFFLFTGPFLFFRERGAGPGASRAYGRDGRTDGPKSCGKIANVFFYLCSVWQFL